MGVDEQSGHPAHSGPDPVEIGKKNENRSNFFSASHHTLISKSIMFPIAAYTPKSELEVIVLVVGVFLAPPITAYWLLTLRFFTPTIKSEVGFSRLKYIIWLFAIGLFFVGMTLNSNSALEAENLRYAAWFFTLYPLSRRIQNIGFSRWWCLLSLVPIINVWMNLSALFYPTLKKKTITSKNSHEHSPTLNWRIATKESGEQTMDLASIKLMLQKKSLTSDDLYWDEELSEWTPLYCHPEIEKEIE